MSVQTNFKENIENLLQKEVDRKDFLKLAGVAIVTALGMGIFFNTVLRHKPTSSQSIRPSSKNDQTTSYGGK
jgi:hypothetical protein